MRSYKRAQHHYRRLLKIIIFLMVVSRHEYISVSKENPQRKEHQPIGDGLE